MQLVKSIRQMTALAPRPQVLIGQTVKKIAGKPKSVSDRILPRFSLKLNSTRPVPRPNNVNLIQKVPTRRGSPSINFNSQREIVAFGFSVPRPRLTPTGFKTAKPRLLKQVNTAKLKRPGILRPKPPRTLGVGAVPLRRPM